MISFIPENACLKNVGIVACLKIRTITVITESTRVITLNKQHKATRMRDCSNARYNTLNLYCLPSATVIYSRMWLCVTFGQVSMVTHL